MGCKSLKKNEVQAQAISMKIQLGSEKRGRERAYQGLGRQ